MACVYTCKPAYPMSLTDEARALVEPLLPAVAVTAASLQDRPGGRALLTVARPQYPRLTGNVGRRRLRRRRAWVAERSSGG